jgi:L-lactate utilization protein LutB
MYSGPGGGCRTSRMPKLIRQIKGITDKAGRCLYCSHKAQCKCECPCQIGKAA